jgi:type I restriction enzyme S subunit
VSFSSEVYKEYISNFFHSNDYWLQISQQQLGIGQPNVNSQILSRLIIPLAPMEEQQKIV